MKKKIVARKIIVEEQENIRRFGFHFIQGVLHSRITRISFLRRNPNKSFGCWTDNMLVS